MKNIKQNQKLIKETSKIFIIMFLVIIIFTGIGFLFAKNSNLNTFKKDKQYNITTSITVDVIDNYSNVLVSDIANDLNNRLEWYGYSDGSVYIVDGNTLKVDLTLDYLNSTIFGVEDGTQFNFTSLKEANKELLQIFASLFYKGSIEFRSSTEELLFSYDENGNVIFNSPQTETPTSEEVKNSSIISPTSSKLNDGYFNIDEWTQIFSLEEFLNYDKTPIPEMISSAELIYKNGNPYIKIFPKKSYLSLFTEAALYMTDNYDPSTNPSGNVFSIWIGYDVLKNLIYKTDPTFDGSSSLATYCLTDSLGNQTGSVNPLCEPFLLTSDTVKAELNPNADYFLVNANFGKKNAESVVTRINNSLQKYAFEIVNVKWDDAKQNFVFLKVFVILMLILMVLEVLSFIWYFGLVGGLFSSVSLFGFGTSLALASAFLVPLGTMFALGQVILFIFISFMALFLSTSIKKNMNSGFTTKEHIRNYGSSILKMFILLFIFVFPILIGTLFNFEFIRLNLMLLILILYIVFSTMLLLSFFIFSTLILLTSEKDLRSGINKNKISKILYGFFAKSDSNFKLGINFEKYESLPIRKYSTIAFSTLMILGIIVSSFLLIFTGSGFNSSLTGDNYYQYDIVQVVDVNEKEYHYNSYDGFLNGINDPILVKTNFNSLSEHQKVIKNIFKPYTKIKNINFNYETRFFTNEIDIPPGGEFPYYPTIETVYDYGYSIQTKSQISGDELNIINSELENINDSILVTLSNGTTYNFNYHFEINLNSGSIIATTNNPITNSTISKQFINILSLILVLLIILFIGVILFSKISGSVSIISTMALEIFTALFVLPLIFIPVSSSIVFVIPIFLSISFIVKIIPIRNFFLKYKSKFSEEEEIDREEIHVLINNEFKNFSNSFLLIINGIFWAILILLALFNIYLISVFIFGVVFSIVMFFNQFFILPNYFKNLETSRRYHNHKVFEKYNAESKDVDYLDEEYIKGINY